MEVVDRHAWERPGADQVAPGIWRIPLPLPGDSLKAVNVYAVLDNDRLVMIDGGWALEAASDLLASTLKEIGFAPGDIREFLVTHVHRDHYTLAVEMRRAYGGRVALGEGEKVTLDALRTIDKHPDIGELHRAGAWQLSAMLEDWRGERPGLDNWEYPDRWLADGLELPLHSRTLRVIATPGHTRGHVVFHDAENEVLFAGDHVLPHITPSISVETVRPPLPLQDYLRSLEAVRALPDARLLPAHGPVTTSVHARVEALVKHHEERLAAMKILVEKGATTAFDVAVASPWGGRSQRRYDDLEFWDQMLAVHETVAHLKLLVETSDLTTSTDDAGVVHYAP